jgi:transcriptional regulator with PAS, ATPase and Fis domain
MQKVYELISSVASTNATVLIRGETGTGKELVARAIHYNSSRCDHPFVAVSCAALPEDLLESELFGHVKGAFTGAISDRKGRFERADEGTLFLDEIGNISLRVQAKLLRVLGSKEFEKVGGTEPMKADVRLIAATNRNLEEKIRSSEFREDLYYRLNVVQIGLPPLRERKEDIPLLVGHFISKFNGEIRRSISSVSQEAMGILVHYNWPGNVRQLENAIEHAFIQCSSGFIQPEHLPQEILSQKRIPAEESALSSVEREAIESALRKRNWNRTLTAMDLGISHSTLWRKIRRYRIRPSQCCISKRSVSNVNPIQHLVHQYFTFK